jgi:hypothetical protein
MTKNLTGLTGDAGYFFAFRDERPKSVIPLRGSELILRLQIHRGLFMGLEFFSRNGGIEFSPFHQGREK